MLGPGLVYIAGTTGKMIVTSAITPIVQSTVSLVSSLHTSGTGTTIQECLTKNDIACTLQTIEATCLALKCDEEPLKTAAANVVECIEKIHQLLTRVADITASHNAGYISRWRQLNLDNEIEQLEGHMQILHNRFKLLCALRSVVDH